MSASRNLGLAHASGSFVAFLDCDDVYLPDKLAYQLTILEREPHAAFTYGPALHWRGWSGLPEDASRDHLRRMPGELDRIYRPPELLHLFLARRAATPATCSILIRREAIEQVGGFETAFTAMYEDQAFFYKLCAHHSGFLHSRSLDRYRQHPDSAVWQAASDGSWATRGTSATHGTFLRWLVPYLETSGCLDATGRRLARSALRPYEHPRLDRVLRGAASVRRRVGVGARRLTRRTALKSLNL